MKRWTRSTVWAVVLAFPLVFALLPGCNDDNGVAEEPCTPNVQTWSVITNPLAPAPGDTTLLTVQATGEGCGSWPAYNWTATGGQLLQTQGITVRWVAPDDPGLYGITCRASIETSRDTAATEVMVRDFQYVNTGKIASLKPMMVFGNLTFIAEYGTISPRSTSFLGYGMYRWSGPGSSVKITNTGEPQSGSYEFAVSGDGSWAWGSFITTYYASLRQQRMNVWRFPTAGFGSSANVSADNGGVGIVRKNQHRYPYSNEYGSQVVWKYHFAGSELDGTTDIFTIAFWDQLDGPGNWYQLTQGYDTILVQVGAEKIPKRRYYQNVRPMFSPDESNILYFVDTTGVFEPCLIPMVGGRPDTLQRHALMTDPQTGVFEAAGVSISEKTVLQWNPVSNLLAFIAQGYLVFFDYESETVALIDGLEKVQEFSWAPDGSQLVAVTAEGGVFIVSAAGAVSGMPVYVRERATDDIIGASFSPSLTEPKIGFRLVRKGKTALDSWSALIVVDLSSGGAAYASPAVPWHSSRELDVPYTWKRILWEDDNSGIYAPFAVLDDVNYHNKDYVIFHSFEN